VAAATDLPLPLSNAGKSSEWSAGFAACKAIAFESTVLVAKLFRSCLACEVGVSDVKRVADVFEEHMTGIATDAAGVDGTDT